MLRAKQQRWYVRSIQLIPYGTIVFRRFKLVVNNMLKPKLTLSAAVVAGVLVAASSANAVQFNFQNLVDANTGTGTDFDPNEAGGTAIANRNDWVSSDTPNGVFGGSLSWTTGGITVTATGSYFDGTGSSVASVIQDHSSGGPNDLAGLGVYHLQNTPSDDNVTGDTVSGAYETLMLNFSQQVSLSGLLFRDAGHNALAAGNYLFNGNQETFGTDPTSATGTSFSFRFGGDNPSQFYVSSLNAVATPDGGITAILMGLSVVGIGVFGRKRVAK